MADGLSDALKTQDRDSFAISAGDITNKAAFVDLLIDYGLSIELTVEENKQ